MGIVIQGAAPCSKVGQVIPSKNRITVNLSEGEFLALDELAARSKVSRAWLGRHAINSLLELAQNDEHQLPLPLVGLKRKGER